MDKDTLMKYFAILLMVIIFLGFILLIFYEDNNKDCIFYFGFVGFLYHDVGNKNGRFEIAYRNTDSTYYKK